MKLIVKMMMVFCLTGTVYAQDSRFDPLGATSNLPRMIRVHASFIEMSHEEAAKILEQPRTGSNDTQLKEKVMKMVADKKASLLETAMVTARPGAKATVESIEEHIYPTEYEPAETGVLVKQDDGKIDLKASMPVGPTATAFETRNVGTILEIEPNVGSSDQLVELRFSPQIVYRGEDSHWKKWKSITEETTIRMPTFYSLRIETGVTMMNGQPLLVGVYSPKNDKGKVDRSRKVFIFVRCDVLTTGL